MPEPPDFNTIALRVLIDLDALPLVLPSDASTGRQAIRTVAEQLRLVRNARGAADLAEVDEALAGASPSMKVIDRVIRALDR